MLTSLSSYRPELSSVPLSFTHSTAECSWWSRQPRSFPGRGKKSANETRQEEEKQTRSPTFTFFSPPNLQRQSPWAGRASDINTQYVTIQEGTISISAPAYCLSVLSRNVILFAGWMWLQGKYYQYFHNLHCLIKCMFALLEKH